MVGHKRQPQIRDREGERRPTYAAAPANIEEIEDNAHERVGVEPGQPCFSSNLGNSTSAQPFTSLNRRIRQPGGSGLEWAAGPGERAQVKDSSRRAEGEPHVKYVEDQNRREGRRLGRGLRSRTHWRPGVLLAA